MVNYMTEVGGENMVGEIKGSVEAKDSETVDEDKICDMLFCLQINSMTSTKWLLPLREDDLTF